MTDLSKFLEILNPDPFEEYPVDLETFVTGDGYLNHKPLSPIQATAVECMSQIYRQEDLERFMPPGDAATFYKQFTKREIILQLGKGCHHGDTPVYDPDMGGWKPIRHHNGSVHTLNGEAEATDSFVEGYGQIVNVTFRNEMSEKVYIGHKYLVASRTNEGWKYEYKEAKDLKPGMKVVWSKHYPINNPVDMPDSELLVLSTLLNECYYENEDEIVFRVHYSRKNLLKTLADYNGEPQYDTATMKRVTVRDEYFMSVIRKYFKPGETLRMPEEFWKNSNDALVKWLRYILYEGIGRVGVVRYGQSRVGYGFSRMSLGLGEDVAHVIMRLGIVPTLFDEHEVFMHGPGRHRRNVYVDSYPMNERFAEAIGEGGKHKWRNYVEPGKRLAVKAPIELDDRYLVGVRSVTPLEKDYYWTKTVPYHGHYVGNGPVSANSGKDLLSTIAVAYVVYKLLCLKDPAEYYGQQSGNAIDIINIAINAQQARTVFFKNFKNIISQSPWFRGKFTDTQDSISFIKSVTAYSGHSERESHEGLNLIMVILDEISGFGAGNPLNTSTKSSENIYMAFSQAVTSRYPDFGKVALLSFPRSRDDFITTHYDDEVRTKDVVRRSHTYVINPELGDSDDNKLTIEWDEDHITAYKNEKVWAIRRPSWDVNPLRNIEEYKGAFVKNYYDSLQRFACMPTNIASDSFFRNAEKIDYAMTIRNPVSPARVIDPSWKPDPNVTYYVHADLAQKQDKCAVAVAHVEKWTKVDIGHGIMDVVPHVVVDMLAWWEPKREGPVDLSEVKRWIMALRERGLNIGLITFDRWSSFDLIRELNDRGFKADTLSVAKKHYEDFAMILYEERVALPLSEDLREEMLNLKVIKNKVDHPSKSGKDLSDAVTGAMFNAISRTPRNIDMEIEVHTWAPDRTDATVQPDEEQRAEAAEWLRTVQQMNVL